MMKIELKKIVTILLCLVLLCILFAPIIHADVNTTASKYSITVNYLGLKNKSTIIDLINTDYFSVKNVLYKLESDLRKSDTKFDSNIIIEKALNNLHKHGLFGTMDLNAIKRLCLRQKLLSEDIMLPSTWDNRGPLPPGSIAGPYRARKTTTRCIANLQSYREYPARKSSPRESPRS